MSNPSLILPQSPAYGEDYVYAAQVNDGVVPLYNVLPLTFTRASGGTRINKDGLVQNMPYNLVEQSNTFGTSPWSNTLDTGATLTYTANYGIAPDGSSTAGRLQMALNGSNYSQKNQIISVTNGQSYTYSIWIKSLSGTKDVIFCYDNTNNIHATVTTEWQRFTHTFSGNSQVYARFVLEAGTSTSVDLLIYGAQLNIGSTAQPYLATTDRLNMPRITYPVGGGCGALLLEKQSTNVFTYSEQFDNASWGKVSATITANTTISPDGTQDADTFTTTGGGARIFQTLSLGAGSYTTSIYVKKLSGSGNMRFFGIVDGSGVSQSFTPTDNWQRFTGNFTASTGITEMQLREDGFSGSLAIWGFQLEASSYATSYIPTTSTSSTRVADACYKTGISNLIGQTEGTMFVDTYVGNETDEVYGWLQSSLSGNPNDSIQINRSGSSIQAQIYNGSTPTALITGGTISKGQRIKVAFAYKVNDCVLYLNGTQIGVDTSTAIPACSLFQLGAYPPLLNDYTNDGGINNFQLFTTRLTNAELATLTTI